MRNFSNKKYKSAKTCNILDKNYCKLVLMVIIFVPIGQHSPLLPQCNATTHIDFR